MLLLLFALSEVLEVRSQALPFLLFLVCLQLCIFGLHSLPGSSLQSSPTQHEEKEKRTRPMPRQKAAPARPHKVAPKSL